MYSPSAGQARTIASIDQSSEMVHHPLLHDITGSGDPVVLVPGTLTGWESWVMPAERLAEHHRVIRAQLRNVELVEAGVPIPATYTVNTERDALLATLDAIHAPKVDLVGWSMGGLVSLAFALAHPGRVRTLTLIEPPACWLLRVTGQATRFAEVEATDRALSNRPISIDDLKAFLFRAGLGDEGTDFETLPRWRIMVRNRQTLTTNAAVWDHEDSLEQLRALDIPILAIKGMDTSAFLATIVDDIIAHAPNTTLLELPGGHACHLENLDRFIVELERFLVMSQD